ncbi:AIM24 family protein [Tepidibacillus marianensis]|uniref:AIM24 family protein n=1 Tax=Tepidibacillus marianensis TaxID=3131995 RepID=UPI0030D37B6B
MNPLTLTYFEPKGGPGTIGFTPTAPGKIIPLQITPQNILQKDAFMVAEEGVELSVFFQRKLGTGFFGGEGFIMQKLVGNEMAFAEVDGEVVEINLAPGEMIDVDTTHVALFEASVDMEIRFVKGFKNVIFGGEGLFLTRLTGPGKVWLQTMTIANLA